MAKKLTTYRIFIASPSGLDAERRAFQETVEEYNKSDAHHDGVHFEPCGWEDTLGGEGRPQEIINEDVRQCDYFVMVLGGRWGSPPGPGRFSSGTVEELDVARKCGATTVIFFKEVDDAELDDPDPQLRKVLAFKEKLERQKSYLVERFRKIPDFTVRLRKHLARWRRRAVTRSEAVEDEASRLVYQQLQGKQCFELDGIALEDMFQYISNVAGVNIHVKWAHLNAAGVDRNSEVNIRLVDVAMEKALRVVLEDVAGIIPLGFDIDLGVITVSTQSDIDQSWTAAQPRGN